MRNTKLRYFWIFLIFALITLLGLRFFFISLDQPQKVVQKLSEHKPSIQNGEYIFNASGCSGCHVSQGSDNRQELGGGKAFQTAFGTFFAPNISMSRQYGIGSWSLSDFNNAVRNGLSPQGNHYFPSFPYNAYNKMKEEDLIDLWHYWKTLPAIESPNISHDLNFPFSMREAIWFWKKAFVRTEWVFTETDPRGFYLVEAMVHCAECHTPRNKLGGLSKSSWMMGGNNPTGAGTIPNILTTTNDWSQGDIEEYLLSGFTPEFDTAGGNMVEVIEGTKLLTTKDRAAIAKYIKDLSARNNYNEKK